MCPLRWRALSPDAAAAEAKGYVARISRCPVRDFDCLDTWDREQLRRVMSHEVIDTCTGYRASVDPMCFAECMANKTLVLLGDSLTRTLWVSLGCSLHHAYGGGVSFTRGREDKSKSAHVQAFNFTLLLKELKDPLVHSGPFSASDERDSNAAGSIDGCKHILHPGFRQALKADPDVLMLSFGAHLHPNETDAHAADGLSESWPYTLRGLARDAFGSATSETTAHNLAMNASLRQMFAYRVKEVLHCLEGELARRPTMREAAAEDRRSHWRRCGKLPLDRNNF